MTLGESSNRSFYDVDSQTYDAQRWNSWGGAFTNRVQQQILLDLCADWEGHRVLEVGPGTGRFSVPLLEKRNRMVLSDISPEMLATAQRKIEQAGQQAGVEAYIEASIYELPFANHEFDHAVSLNVFNHLERPGDALKELARVIKPGSTLLFNYANLQSIYWPAARRINARKKAVGQDVFSTWERPEKMRQTIEQAGLELVRLIGHVHAPRAIEKYPVLPLLIALDAIGRKGPLQRFASFHFCLCRKRSAQSN